MNNFETCPVGTMAKLKEMEEREKNKMFRNGKQMLWHNDFRYRFPYTDLAEEIFEEIEKYDIRSAYGEHFQACLIAGKMLSGVKKENELLKSELKDITRPLPENLTLDDLEDHFKRIREKWGFEKTEKAKI